MNTKELKILCWQYISHIYMMSHPEEYDISKMPKYPKSDKIRTDLHNAILQETGLSAFDFGGVPFWMEITDIDSFTERLYNALCKKIAQKKAYND